MSFEHFICGTCIGERERRKGMFEGDRRRRMVIEVKWLPDSDAEYTQYCARRAFDER